MTFKELEILRSIGLKAKEFCYFVDFEFGDEPAMIFSYPTEKTKDMIHFFAKTLKVEMFEEIKGIDFKFENDRGFHGEILHCEQCIVYFEFENFGF